MRRSIGQGLVELVVTLPLLLFIVFGLVKVARWFYALNAVQNAAREAARYAATGQPSRSRCEALGYAGASTTSDKYNQWRVKAIEDFAVARARTALRADKTVTGVSRPGYLGAIVYGSPTFSAPPVVGYAGSPRARVEVQVIYNHPITIPFLPSDLPTIRVIGWYQIVNEPWAGGGPDVPPTLVPAPALPPLDSDGDGWPDVAEQDV